MIRNLSSNDYTNFIHFCSQRDPFSDFYITENNQRLFLNNLKVAKKVFKDCIKGREKCFIKEEAGLITGIILITGYKDKTQRKYLKILSNNENTTRDLFRYLEWQSLTNLFIKSHSHNKNFVKFDEKNKKFKPSYFVRKSGFRIIAERSKEILMKKEDKANGFR